MTDQYVTVRDAAMMAAKVNAQWKGKVLALADGIKAGTQDFMAGWEKDGEGISTRMSGETAAMVVQVRCELESYIRELAEND